MVVLVFTKRTEKKKKRREESTIEVIWGID